MCASAVRSSAQAQCTAIDATKHKHDDKYYRSFAPFVITVSGGVSQASAEALMPGAIFGRINALSFGAFLYLFGAFLYYRWI